MNRCPKCGSLITCVTDESGRWYYSCTADNCGFKVYEPDWKMIRPLTPFIGLDGKPVQCKDCHELHSMIANGKASILPSKCFPVGGSPCSFIKLGGIPEVCHDDPYEVHQQIKG